MADTHTPVSVYLITKNEAQHLAEVLTPLQVFDEIVLVDSGSDDDTVAIAEGFGARVIHQDWLGFAKQKQFAMQQCQHEWVVNVDGDEVLTEQQVQEIKSLAQADKADAIRFWFEDLFWGQTMSPKSGKRSIVRAFKKSIARYPMDRKVHENIVLPKNANVVNLDGLVKHYGYGTSAILMEKQNKYSSLKAEEKFEKGKGASALKLLLVFPLTFIKFYLFKKMCLSGWRGLVHAMIESQYAFLKEAKLMELNYRKSHASTKSQD